jgi:UMF1 family MFS transporter
VVALVGFIGPDSGPGFFGVTKDEAAHVRATNLLVALWFTLFAVPLFLFSPDQPATGISPLNAVRSGLSVLAETIRGIRRQRPIVRFLIASALYRDALATLFAVGGLYAAGTFGMSFQQILLFAIGLNVTAGLGAIAFAWLDDAWGSKRVALVSLAGLIGFGVPLLLIVDASLFIVLALGLGIFVGPVQAASRSLMARLSPPGMQTEMFGFYALTGKSVAFLGPLTFGWATSLFDNQRAGMASIVMFFALGFLLLLGVREPPHRPA